MSHWKLVDRDTRAELAVGDERTTFRNEPVKIDSLQPPDQPGSMGRVYVRFGDGSKSSGLFPGVVNAEFVHGTGERARVEKESLNAQPFDAAFTIISYNTFHSRFGPPPHPRPIDLRMILKDRFSESEISNASRRVSALLKEAYQAGDDFLSKRLTYAEITNGLRERHPGFSDNCYDDTFNQGCFTAR
jgi:hypothetical protein